MANNREELILYFNNLPCREQYKKVKNIIYSLNDIWIGALIYAIGRSYGNEYIDIVFYAYEMNILDKMDPWSIFKGELKEEFKIAMRLINKYK